MKIFKYSAVSLSLNSGEQKRPINEKYLHNLPFSDLLGVNALRKNMEEKVLDQLLT